MNPPTPVFRPSEIAEWVIVGAGRVGRLVAAQLLRSGCAVAGVDLQRHAWPEGATFIVGDICRPNGETGDALAAADVVLLAVPERVVLSALPQVAALMRRGALLADTASVKSAIAERFGEVDPPVEMLSLAPMFGPDLELIGQTAVAVMLKGGPRSQATLRLLSAWGVQTVIADAREHDRMTALTQVATHAAVLAFGLALADQGAQADDLLRFATPPHRVMLSLLARIASAEPRVYWEIQHSHPFARSARYSVGQGLSLLSELADHEDESRLSEAFGDLRAMFGDRQNDLTGACADLVQVVQRGLAARPAPDGAHR